MPPQAPWMTNTARVTAAVSEFLNIWACEGNASLTLDTKNGSCTVSFQAHLGHPGALLLPTPAPPVSPTSSSPGQCYRGQASPCSKPTPSSSSSGQRYRGTADKQRSNVRAANYQALHQTAGMAQGASEKDPTVPPVSPKQSTAAEDPSKVLTAANSETAAAITGAATVTSENIVIADMASKNCQQLLPPPAENLNCWNCEHLMTPEHQCGEPPASSSSGNLNNDSTQSVTVASSPSSTPPGSPVRTFGRRIFPKKFVCDDS